MGRRGRCVKHWSRTPADPGLIPGAGDKNKRLIFLPTLGGVLLVARISRTAEVPSLTLRVEVKEPTDDVKHSGSDHRQGISSPIFRTLPLLRHLRERNK